MESSSWERGRLSAGEPEEAAPRRAPRVASPSRHPRPPLWLVPLKISELRGHNAPLKAESPGFVTPRRPPAVSPRAWGSSLPGERKSPARGGSARPHKGALFPNQRGPNKTEGQGRPAGPWRAGAPRVPGRPPAPAGRGSAPSATALAAPGFSRTSAAGGRAGPGGLTGGAKQPPLGPDATCKWEAVSGLLSER